MYMYEDFVDFVCCFHCGKLPNVCHCVGIAQNDSQQSVASTIIKYHTALTERLTVATADLSGTQRIHWGIGVPGILSDFRSSPSSPTTFLGLCSLGDYRQCIESPLIGPAFNSTEIGLTFTIYDCVLTLRSKKVLFYLSFTFVDINSDTSQRLQRRNVATSSRKDVKISRWVNRHSVDQEESKLKLSNGNNFAFSCINVKTFQFFVFSLR